MSDITIRRLVPSDGVLLRATRLAAISDTPEAFGITYDETLARTPAEWTERCTNVSAGEKEAMFFALEEGVPVGLMGCYFETEDDCWVLISVYVDPAHRGSDLATRMHQFVVDFVGSTGADDLFLEVWQRNPRAIAFYQRLGYEFTGNSKQHPKYPAETELAMVLHLATGR